MSHLNTNLWLDADYSRKLRIHTSVWQHKNLNGELEVAQVISIETVSCNTQNTLNAAQTELLIANLQQHLQNIKECELELMAANEARKATVKPEEKQAA